MNALAKMVRLTRAGAVIAWSGARVLPDELRLPPPLALFGRMTAPLRKDKANGTGHEAANDARLSTALTSLGPSYIKLGQFLATRDDIIGRELAADLATLQDRLPPFSQDEARKAVEDALEAPIAAFFSAIGKRQFLEEAHRREMLGYPVSSVADIAQDPQLAARGFWQDVPAPGGGFERHCGAFVIDDGKRAALQPSKSHEYAASA